MLTQFSLRLACGLSLMLLLTSARHVSGRFFRVNLLVVMGLSVLAALAARESGAAVVRVLAIAAAVGCFAGSIAWMLEQRRVGRGILLGITAVTGAAAVFQHGGPPTACWAVEGLRWVDPLAGAAVLGATLTAMLLGHSYLVAPGMAMDPLKRMTAAMAGALLVRALLAALGLVVLFAGDDVAWDASLSPTTFWLWICLRWLAGIAGPLVVTAMVWQTIKIRSTQSATGILYAGVILVFLGELTAALLTAQTGTPL